MNNLIYKAEILIEALPYIKEFYNQTEKVYKIRRGCPWKMKN